MSLLCKLGLHAWRPYRDTEHYISAYTIAAEGYCKRDCGVPDVQGDKELVFDYDHNSYERLKKIDNRYKYEKSIDAS